MGYYIFSYGINTNKIQAAIGSKDDNLYNEILDTETFKNYSSQDFKGHITTGEALEHLIFGKPYNTSSAHAYWYAFITLCSYLGESLDGTHEIKMGYETDLINQYLKSDFGVNITIEEVLINGGDIFGLPAIQDWPLSGLLNRTTLIALQSKFNAINITDEMLEKLFEEDDEKEMAYDSIRQIQENITYCLNNNMDLISFCH
jgi:hypothetical protein